MLRIGFVGAGKVGSTLARAWYKAGNQIEAVHSRSHAHQLAKQVNAVICETPPEVIQGCDLTLLTVPDDMIGVIAKQINGANLTGKYVIHTSGAHSAKILHPLTEQHATTGSLHPALPFADVETALANLDGTTFAVEAENADLQDILVELVDAIGGNPIVVPTEQKALYHAALVFASNYTVTLYDIAKRMMQSFSSDDGAIQNALNNLVQGTINNLEQHGTPNALTGPLVREDTGTIEAHLQALYEFDEKLAEVYTGLARQTFRMLIDRGVPTANIDHILRQEIDHGTDNDS